MIYEVWWGAGCLSWRCQWRWQAGGGGRDRGWRAACPGGCNWGRHSPASPSRRRASLQLKSSSPASAPAPPCSLSSWPTTGCSIWSMESQARLGCLAHDGQLYVVDGISGEALLSCHRVCMLSIQAPLAPSCHDLVLTVPVTTSAKVKVAHGRTLSGVDANSGKLQLRCCMLQSTCCVFQGAVCMPLQACLHISPSLILCIVSSMPQGAYDASCSTPCFSVPPAFMVIAGCSSCIPTSERTQHACFLSRPIPI